MTEPSTEQPDPRTIARPEPHKSGGEQDRLGPFEYTLSPTTLGPQGRDKQGMAATASEGTAPKDGTGKSVRLPAASTLAVDTNSRDTFRPDEPAPRAAGSAHKTKTSLSPTNR